MEVSKTFLPYSLCICCPSGPLHLVARVPASGYTPGETINVEIDVDNKSKLTAGIRVQLIKVNIFVSFRLPYSLVLKSFSHMIFSLFAIFFRQSRFTFMLTVTNIARKPLESVKSHQLEYRVRRPLKHFVRTWLFCQRYPLTSAVIFAKFAMR